MPLLYPLLTLTVIALIAWFVNTTPVAEGLKSFANIVVSLIVVGIVLWLINSYVPMAGSIKAILNVVVVVATCIWVLKAFGLWGEIERRWTNMTSHRP